ncbi:DNA (Cytosine-5)-methyltransferase DRM1/2 isoform 3 [Hibiscus syriacus]|uniref:DNA (Cytosine-5)-methyltransferase DRM1/2 isoform 3 n=1 Tax=Hibiscus syriacus TaxID=106335 RepID=A0A6A2ZBE3_HIBSY|nr:DNA (Cytosine-5)-methyltransferase DRM1/2 isoform 3 [Hibiscus syriacus]
MIFTFDVSVLRRRVEASMVMQSSRLDEALVGSVSWVKFGKSPNYVVTHPIAATWRGSWLLEASVGIVAVLQMTRRIKIKKPLKISFLKSQLKTSCIGGLMDDPKVLKTSCTEGLKDNPEVLKTSCIEGLIDDPEVLKTSCTEGLADDPKVLKTSSTKGITDDPNVLKTSSTEGLTNDPKVLKTSCTEGLTDDPEVLKTLSTEGLTDDLKVLKTSCTEGLTDDPKVLKISKTERLTDDPKLPFCGKKSSSCLTSNLEVEEGKLHLGSINENHQLILILSRARAEASIAIERYIPDSSIAELIDFICAAQMAKAVEALLSIEDRKPLCNDPNYKKRRNSGYDFWKRKNQGKLEKKTLPENALGPLYFYYENVALAPVGVWTKMSWKCQIDRRICKALEAYDDEPPSSVHKYVLDECRKWNLVWVGRNKIVILEPNEVEMLLGFPKNHTRRGGSARDMFPSGINVLSLFSGINDAEVAFYWLNLPLKANVQELNGDQLEQLMSRFVKFDLVVGGIPYALPYLTLPEIWKGLVDSKTWLSLFLESCNQGHNGYNLDKENDRHRRGNNDASRSEPVSRYNQSASGDLFIPIIHLNETYDSVIRESARDID